jgi:hypothetical protein
MTFGASMVKKERVAWRTNGPVNGAVALARAGSRRTIFGALHYE